MGILGRCQNEWKVKTFPVSIYFKNHFLIIHWMLKTNIMHITSSVSPRNLVLEIKSRYMVIIIEVCWEWYTPSWKWNKDAWPRLEGRWEKVLLHWNLIVVLELKWTRWGECIPSRRKRQESNWDYDIYGEIAIWGLWLEFWRQEIEMSFKVSKTIENLKNYILFPVAY